MGRQVLALLVVTIFSYGVAVTISNNDLKEMLSTEMMDFAVDMARILHNKSTLRDNIVFSPVNVYAALSLSHLAAAGKTRDQLADILEWPKNNKEALNIHKNLARILNSLQEQTDNPKSVVKMANGVFVDEKCTFRSKFTETMKEYYKEGDVFTVDFSRTPVKGTETINQWMSKATIGDIPQLFAEPLPQTTNFVLANTLYFNGRWAQKFPKENTKKGIFSNYGTPIEVNMMNHAENLPYINETKLQFEAIAKPYDGQEYAMIFINLYDSQRHRNLSDYLSAEVMKKTVAQMQPADVDYTIPRVRFTYIKGMKEALQEQGLKDVFENTTLTNMVEKGPPMKLTDVYHGTSIEMDEEGTHAGAIQATEESEQVQPPNADQAIKFNVKTPFMVCLWHVKTSTCLFFGYIHKPEGP